MTDEKAKKLRRIYNREWQRANPEKVKLYQERYWKKKVRELEERGADLNNLEVAAGTDQAQ